MSLGKLHTWEDSVWQWRSGGLAVYEAGIVGLAGALSAWMSVIYHLSFRKGLLVLFDPRNLGILLLVWALQFGLMLGEYSQALAHDGLTRISCTYSTIKHCAQSPSLLDPEYYQCCSAHMAAEGMQLHASGCGLPQASAKMEAASGPAVCCNWQPKRHPQHLAVSDEQCCSVLGIIVVLHGAAAWQRCVA